MIVTSTQLHQYLEGAAFPSDKATLIRTAEQNGAPEHLISVLDEIQDMKYDNFSEFAREIDEVEPDIIL